MSDVSRRRILTSGAALTARIFKKSSKSIQEKY